MPAPITKIDGPFTLGSKDIGPARPWIWKADGSNRTDFALSGGYRLETYMSRFLRHYNAFIREAPQWEPALRERLSDPTPIPYEPAGDGQWRVFGTLPRRDEVKEPWTLYSELIDCLQQLGFPCWTRTPQVDPEAYKAAPSWEFTVCRIMGAGQRNLVVAFVLWFGAQVDQIVALPGKGILAPGAKAEPSGTKGDALAAAREALKDGPRSKVEVTRAVEKVIKSANARNNAYTYVSRFIRESQLLSSSDGTLRLPGQKSVEPVGDDEL